jgi:hypothetical protein
MVLRRNTLGAGSKTIPLDVTVYGTSDGNFIKQLIGEVVQAGSVIVISNVEIAERQWPGPPIEGDQLIRDGQTKTLDGPAESKYLGSEVLVHVCKVTG